jgi:YD repeat-containing protein
VNPGTGPNPDYPKDKADNASYCGWYTAFIEDRTVGGPDQVTGFYPHYIRITYDARDNFKHAISQIQDSTDRITAVHNCVWEEHANPDGGDIIERCVDGTRDTDPEPIGATSRDAVATFAIDLPAFGNSATSIQPSAKATYRFYYEHLPLYRANPEHEVELEYSTLKLVRVDYPTYHHEPSGLQDEYSLYFGYSGVEDGYCGVAGGGDFGELTCRTLPLLRRSGGASIVSGNPCTQLGDFASISYRYNYYKYFGAFQVGGHSVPKRCTAAPGTCAGGGGVLSPTGVTRQLVKKHVSLPMENGQGGFNLEEGWWKYCRAHSISLTNPTEVVVTDPFENHTVYRYRASAASASQGGIDPEDGAAPEWVDGVNYEVAYYEGTAIAGRLVRTITQEHDADRMSANSHHTKENLRSRREVVRYDDDGARETVTTRNDWNDFGDWRSTSSTTVEVPEQKHVRREYKVWNAATDPYLPTLVEVEEVSDGLHVLARSDMSYDSGGRLLARVDKLTPPPFGAPHDMTQYPGDLKTLYTYSQASGNILTKNMTVGTGDIGYTMKYTYAPAVGSCIARAVALVEPSNVCGGYLASKAFLYYGVEERWKSIDRDRDANTGLIMATRDPAGIATTYDYDALGRILSIVPAGEQATSIDYASLNKTTVTQGADPNKVYTEYTYDRLGRLIASAKRPYDPALGVACQTTRYDIAGRTTFQSEWWYANPPTSCAPWQGGQAGTTFSFSEPATPNLIDPFGRVRRTVTDDDKVTSTEYFGESSRVTVNDIAGPNGVTFASTTTFYSDPFGRLVYVDSPEGTGGADALYTYDALDRLLRVDLTNGPLIAQTRRFVYDALGRLKQAENPESGTIVNLSFDALGNVTLRQDASGNIFESVYDFAGRLEAMWTNESYVVYNWYDETYGFIPNRGLGKLTTIESYNKGNWESIERRFYEGVGGRLSKTIHEFISWPPLTKAETEYQYDTRGQLISIKYPYESNSTRPRLQVDYTYANGYALSATDHAASDPPLGQVTYNAAGGVATLLTPGGGKTEMTFDSRNRPKSITIGKVGVSGWSRLDLETGDYAYDGAGNISQIGPDQWEPEHPNIHPNKFGYDAANRLISAHTQFNDGGSPAIYQESFNYDSLGNMLQHQLTANLTTTEIDTFTMPTPNRNRIASRRTTFSSSPGVNPESVTFSYDHNGNLIEGGRLWWPVDTISKQEIQRYEYGHLNRLYAVHSVGNQAASTGLSEIARFGYDASGSRIWKEEGAKHLRTVYVRDPAGQVLSEFNAIRVPGVVLPYGALTPRWTKDHVSLAGRPLAQREKLWPDPPGGLLASAMVAPAGYGKVKLGWIEEPNTQVYKVYRRYESTEYTYTHIATVSPGSQSIIYYIDPTLYPAGTALIYFVTCVDTDGHESQASATIRVIAADNVKPERPWLTAFADDGRVTLNFLSEDESGIRGYVIYRGLSSTSLSIINMQLVTDSTYVDLNLENGTTYYYQVMAQDTLGRWSDKSCEGAICPLSAVPKNYAPPSPPKDLIACSSPGKTDDVRLYWSPNPDTDGTVSYKIFRSTIPFGEGPVGGAGLATTTGTTYLDAGLEAGTYYYALTAVDDSTPPLESTWSELAAVSVRTGGPEPGERIFTQSSEGVVRLTWNVVGATPSKYILYRSLNGSSTACYQRIAEITPPVPLTMIEYVDSGAPLAAASDYVVTRLTGSSESQFSRPTLGIPLERPRQVFQCSGSDYEAAGDPVGTIVQWAPPPTARPYHPLLASTADGTFGFLQGYHMYHYAVGDDRWNPSDCNGEFKCWDDSLIRTVVEDANDPIDKYRLKYEVSQFAPWAWRDPYYPLQDSNDPTPVSPPFSGEQEMFNY